MTQPILEPRSKALREVIALMLQQVNEGVEYSEIKMLLMLGIEWTPYFDLTRILHDEVHVFSKNYSVTTPETGQTLHSIVGTMIFSYLVRYLEEHPSFPKKHWSIWLINQAPALLHQTEDQRDIMAAQTGCILDTTWKNHEFAFARFRFLEEELKPDNEQSGGALLSFDHETALYKGPGGYFLNVKYAVKKNGLTRPLLFSTIELANIAANKLRRMSYNDEAW